MSDDSSSQDSDTSGADNTPVLRREALLPTERNRGLGTVAVVCTMAGVASGLALATTLMAMQVADTMQTRTCPYAHHHHAPPVEVIPADVDHGFLGIRYVFHDGAAEIESVLPGTPAEGIALRPHDKVLAIDGVPVESAVDLQERIYTLHSGMRPVIVIERDGVERSVQPTLISWPNISY